MVLPVVGSVGRPGAGASYATLNPSDAVTGAAFAWSNLMYDAVTTNGSARATKPLLGGKYYWETWTLTDDSLIGNFGYAGFANLSYVLTALLGATTNSVGIISQTGAITLNAATLATIGEFKDSGDVCQIAVNDGTKRLWARVNGAGNWNNDAGADPAAGTNGLDVSSVTGSIYPACYAAVGGYDAAVNMGALSFRFTAPTGFVGVPG